MNAASSDFRKTFVWWVSGLVALIPVILVIVFLLFF